MLPNESFLVGLLGKTSYHYFEVAVIKSVKAQIVNSTKKNIFAPATTNYDQ